MSRLQFKFGDIVKIRWWIIFKIEVSRSDVTAAEVAFDELLFMMGTFFDVMV